MKSFIQNPIVKCSSKIYINSHYTSFYRNVYKNSETVVFEAENKILQPSHFS